MVPRTVSSLRRTALSAADHCYPRAPAPASARYCGIAASNLTLNPLSRLHGVEIAAAGAYNFHHE
jgi:hypothetical protein